MKLFRLSQRITDDELVQGCQGRDAKSQRALYDRFSPKMMSLCFRYINQAEIAEEVMSNGFIQCFQHIDQFNFNGSFEGWLRKIVVRACLAYLRSKKNLEFKTEPIEHNVEKFYYTPELYLDADDLMQLIADLPNGYKTVFNLYAIEGYKHAEIAEMLQISENTSKTQLMRARDLLQSRVKALETQLNELTHES
ncbi:MAG: RNA polymerase sigma factor [Saprospiraceae bacterium]